MDSILFDNKYHCIWKSGGTLLLQMNLSSHMWACISHGQCPVQLTTWMNRRCEIAYCSLLLWWNLLVWLQVNGHQIMDEPMEEGESFSHCVSNDGLEVLGRVCVCLLTCLRPCIAVSYGCCLCRMKERIRRFLSLTMWKRAVRKLIHLSLNCSKSSARALLARWGNGAHQSDMSIGAISGRVFLNFSSSLRYFLSGKSWVQMLVSYMQWKF